MKAPTKFARPRKPEPRPTSYPALLLAQNDHRFYFATIPIDDLFPYSFVARRDEDPVSGFQRTLTESRATDIAKYLASGKGSIPSNIVLSAQASANLSYSSDNKSITYVREPRAFLVLDGQHRLWGYQKCTIRHRVPVAIYEGLSRAVEAKLFIDINTNQRGVPAALLLDIKHVAAMESVKEGELRQLFNQLNQDPKSALAGKLSASKSVSGRVSRVTFNRALGSALDGGVLADTDHENRYGLVRNFINAFDAELQDKRLLTRAAYFEAMFDVFDEIVRSALGAHRDVKQASLQEVVRPLAKIDVSGATKGRTKITKTSISQLFKTALRKSIAISDRMI